MIRTAALILMALAAAGPARSEEGGPIRTGEHDGFSRLVLRIDPTTEWSLETTPTSARIFFPGKSLRFGTEDVFELMPRTRVTDVRASVGDTGSTVEVAIGCDCRVSTLFVGARYLALDVADRDFVAPAVEAEVVPEDPAARSVREADAVASAEQVLIQQIERAASQGLIELSNPTADGPAAAEAAEAPPAEVVPPEPPAPPPAPATPPIVPVRVETAHAEPAAIPVAVLDHEQIEATTVFDRDSRRAAAGIAAPAAASECLADAAFALDEWSNGSPLYDQVPDLNRRLVGEFDLPDTMALRDLARLYLRFGFGTEAESLLASLDAPFDDRALLLDLARAAEGRPVAPDGPLAVAAVCPGRHGLWLAIGGAAPVFRDAASFAAAQAAFAELPPDLRELLGPRLMTRLLDAGQPEAARLIHDTATRPGTPASTDLRLAGALLAAAEGDPMAAAKALNQLVEENAANAVDALTRLARLTLDADLPLPENLVIDLRAAAHEHRRTEREPLLRALLAEALARTAALDLAMTAIREARADLPEAAGDLDALAVKILAQAEPEKVGAALYAEVMLAEAGGIGVDPTNDPARRAIAAHLLDLGLPKVALDVLAPALARRDPDALLTAAEAQLRLGAPEQAQAMLSGLDAAAAVDLRARAFALSGDFAEAARVLNDAGRAADAAAYAWPSGDWPRVSAGGGDPRRPAMAAYMAVRGGAREGPEAAADPAGLSPDQAFQEPLPRLDRPSLESARRLLASGRQVEGFIQGVLDDGDGGPQPSGPPT